MHFTYCPSCGSKAIEKEIGDEGIMPYCEQCRRPLWSMFMTCIITAVINEYNEVALLRQEYVSAANYVCVAGVIKLGENAEDTVIREVKEEIGLDVEKLDYIRSYYFERKEMLMLGYKAKVQKAEFVISKEVDSVSWIPLTKALDKLREGSIAWQLVKEIKESVYGI